MPQVTFLEVARAALLPAVLYYLSIYFIVHFFSLRVGSGPEPEDAEHKPVLAFEGVVFFGALAALIGLLMLSFSPFKAVTGSLALILLLSALRPQLNLSISTRVTAIATFVACMIVHQLTFYARDSVRWRLRVCLPNRGFHRNRERSNFARRLIHYWIRHSSECLACWLLD